MPAPCCVSCFNLKEEWKQRAVREDPSSETGALLGRKTSDRIGRTQTCARHVRKTPRFSSSSPSLCRLSLERTASEPCVSPWMLPSTISVFENHNSGGWTCCRSPANCRRPLIHRRCANGRSRPWPPRLLHHGHRLCPSPLQVLRHFPTARRTVSGSRGELRTSAC